MATTSGKTAFQTKLVSGDTGGKDFWLILKYGNGQVLEFDLTLLPGYVPGLTGAAKFIFEHGASQSLGDVSAAFTRERDFAGAVAATERRWQRLLGNETGPDLSELAAALSRAGNIPLEQATELVRAASKELRTALLKDPQLQVALTTIRAERAKATAAKTPKEAPTLESLLAKLAGPAGGAK
jgi:hypothetical protein